MAVFLNRNKRPLAAPIEVAEPFSERPPPSQYAKPWQVAAALSAAVTTTKLIGDAPNSQAEPTPKKRSNPNASYSSGEGVWGRGASLREAVSPPEFPPKKRLSGREREGGGLSTERPPPSHTSSLLRISFGRTVARRRTLFVERRETANVDFFRGVDTTYSR